MPTIEMHYKKQRPQMPTTEMRNTHVYMHPNAPSAPKPNPKPNNDRRINTIPSFLTAGGPNILQLNVEGLTRAKCDVIYNICSRHAISVILLQETHSKSDSDINIHGFSLVDAIHHPHHGIATLVKDDMTASYIARSGPHDQTQWTATDINGTLTIVNVYAPPNTDIQLPPIFPHPVIYSGDFNSHHSNWGYQRNDSNGYKIADWASNGDLHLLFESKQPKNFHSAAWNTYTNPDLTFFSSNPSSLLPSPTYAVGPNFPRSQHRPTFISHPAVIAPTASTSLPRWNFKQANWAKFEELMSNATLPDPCLPDVDCTFQALQRSLTRAARHSIPRGYRKIYIPCWDKQCSELSKKHEEANSLDDKQRTGNDLINYINLRRQERWLSTIKNIDMKHSSREAWNTLNKLTARKSASTKIPPVTPNANRTVPLIQRHLLQTGQRVHSHSQPRSESCLACPIRRSESLPGLCRGRNSRGHPLQQSWQEPRTGQSPP